MKSKIMMYIFCIVFIIAAIWGGYKVWTILKEYKIGDETYKELEQYVNVGEQQNESIEQNTTDIEKNDSKQEGTTIDVSVPTVDFESLKTINNDVVAWIYCEDVGINYPIVQGEDNDYYLHHMIDGTYNKAGSIFMDYRNQSNLYDRHTIIYGHNMLDDSMFSNLNKYKNQEFFNEHPFYILITPEKSFKVEIISGYVANVNNDAWKLEFSNNTEFEEWINTTKKKSLFTSEITPTINDKIITLSTCSYEFNNARFVLVGILTEYNK